MISRRDDEDVLNILQGGATKKSFIFELPSEGGPIFPIFCVVRRSCTSRYASLLNALNMAKIGSAQVMLVLNLFP